MKVYSALKKVFWDGPVNLRTDRLQFVLLSEKYTPTERDTKLPASYIVAQKSLLSPKVARERGEWILSAHDFTWNLGGVRTFRYLVLWDATCDALVAYHDFGKPVTAYTLIVKHDPNGLMRF